MKLFLITKTTVTERQMLVEAGDVGEVFRKVVAPENQGQWREFGPREAWSVEELQMETCDPEQCDEEFPEVVR